MGVVESKLDTKETYLCCTSNRKDRRKQRIKNSVGRREPLEMASSILTAWMPKPEQKPEDADAGHNTLLENIAKGRESLRLQSQSLSLKLLSASDIRPSEKQAKPSDLPGGWTAAQITNLKDAVHRTASVLRIKKPGFFTLQVTRSSS